jgi:hypothetical protein
MAMEPNQCTEVDDTVSWNTWLAETDFLFELAVVVVYCSDCVPVGRLLSLTCQFSPLSLMYRS